MTEPQTSDPLIEGLVQALTTAVDAIVGGVTATPGHSAASGDGACVFNSIADIYFTVSVRSA